MAAANLRGLAGSGVDRNTGKALVGWAHVEQCLGVIFTTTFGERIMREWFGSLVPVLLGRTVTPPGDPAVLDGDLDGDRHLGAALQGDPGVVALGPRPAWPPLAADRGHLSPAWSPRRLRAGGQAAGQIHRSGRRAPALGDIGMSSYTIDDLAGLKRPEIIETQAYEAILAARKADAIARAPGFGIDFDVGSLETDRIVILLEGERLSRGAALRARGNDIARARYLYYARGAELDHLGAFYDVVRMFGEHDARFVRPDHPGDPGPVNWRHRAPLQVRGDVRLGASC